MWWRMAITTPGVTPSCSPTGEYIGDLLEEEFTFAHNVVRTVIDTARERLEVTGFTVNGSGAGVNTGVRLLRSGNGGKQTDGRRADRAHRRGLRDGYSTVSFDSEKGRPISRCIRCGTAPVAGPQCTLAT